MLSAKFHAMACLCRKMASEFEKIEAEEKGKQTNLNESKDKLISLKEVMKRYDMSDTTLYRHRSKNNLKEIKIGKKIFFRESELEKWADKINKVV